MVGRGYKIVLTADRTLMSEYGGGLFLGFSACIPKGLVPDKLYFSIFSPSVETNREGSVKYAPCGLRKIEAALPYSSTGSEEKMSLSPTQTTSAKSSDQRQRLLESPKTIP